LEKTNAVYTLIINLFNKQPLTSNGHLTCYELLVQIVHILLTML